MQQETKPDVGQGGLWRSLYMQKMLTQTKAEAEEVMRSD